MILNEINHKMPIYKDCTLGELMCVGFVIFSSEIIVISLLAKVAFGYASIGVAITLVSFFHLTKLSLIQLQKVKYGKPYGYYKHLIVKRFSELGLVRGLYLTRIGKWSVRRIR